MNRPLVATLAVSIILAVGLYVGYKYKDKVEPNEGTWRGPAARSKVQEYLELLLPLSASDVVCRAEELGKGKFVYIRFDVAASDLPALLEQGKGVENMPTLPSSNMLVRDQVLLSAMAALADPRSRPWWQVDQLTDPMCGQKSGTRNLGAAQLKWRVQVCYGQIPTHSARVYIAFSEEPAGKK